MDVCCRRSRRVAARLGDDVVGVVRHVGWCAQEGGWIIASSLVDVPVSPASVYAARVGLVGMAVSGLEVHVHLRSVRPNLEVAHGLTRENAPACDCQP